MYKRHALSLIFFLSSLSDLNTSDVNPPKFNPSNAIIAWDFHGVLVKKDWLAMVSQIFSILKSDWKLTGLLFWPPFWKELYEANNTCSTSDELLKQIISRYPSLKPHWDKLIILINLHVPIPGSIAVLKKLHQSGYQNYLASNMGEESYRIQKERFPEIFEQFDGRYIPKNTHSKTGLMIGKPCTQYYLELRQYLEEYENTADKTIIFIDNKKENIEGALASNHIELNHIQGIVFSFPEQLRDELNTLLELKLPLTIAT